jgi:rfaE bifunctional protein kinase chain/domain
MKDIHQKLIIDGDIKSKLKEIGSLDRSITLVYGHFNVIHPGHIRFLRNAQEFGDYLVIAVQGDNQFSAETKDLFFTQMERAEGVAALQGVNKVIILDEITFEELVSVIEPKYFVLGKEFEERSNKLIDGYVKIVEQKGGKIIYGSGEIKYATTDYLYQSQEEIQHSKLSAFQKACQRNRIDVVELKEKLNSFSDVKILVIGDTIVDQYVACDAIGMSAEAPVLAIKELEAKEFIGGAAIVASHVKTIGANCHFLSVIGDDDPGCFVQERLNELGVDTTLLTDSSRPTTFKIRYMVNNQKMLRVSRLKDHSINRELEIKLLEKVESLASNLDGIVLCDFVYGVLTDRVLTRITQIAQSNKIKLFGDLQCSSQIGNVCRFKEFDLITPTEREARIAISDHESGLEKLAHLILKDTQSKNLLITLNSNGFIAYQKGSGDVVTKTQHFPALKSNPVDVAGAGDTLLATMAVGLSSGLSLMETAALGTCSAAAAISRLGNIPIKQAELEQYLNTVINQIDR